MIIEQIQSALRLLADKVNQLADAIKRKPDIYYATVQSVSDTLALVVIDGDETATPASLQCAAVAGDRVTVLRRGVTMAAVSRVGGDGGGGTEPETYTLTKSGDTITLTGSAGDTSSVTDSDTTDLAAMTGTLGVSHGGTGGTTAADAVANLSVPFIYVNQVTSASGSRGAHSTGSVTVTLTAPSGFKIAHVLSVASNGGIVPAYVEDSVSALTGQTSKTVRIWWHNGLTSAQTCTFSVRYMCVRDGFLTTNGTSVL